MGKKLRFEFIHNHAEVGERAVFCRVLKVTFHGYKKYVKNLSKPCKYAGLLARIKAIREEDVFNKTYGKRRMYEKLVLEGYKVSYNTVAKVMRKNNLLQPENKPKGLTKADKKAQKSDDLLQRNFVAETPNTKAVTDITEWKAKDGKLYTAGIFDCFDSACLGLGIAENMKAELVEESLIQAAGRFNLKGAISHSDRGSQYTSELFRAALEKFKIRQSMNSAAGRCHDNARCESFWARAKNEILVVYDTKKMKRDDLKIVLFNYFMGYWNNRRICSAIGGVPPFKKRDDYYKKLILSVA